MASKSMPMPKLGELPLVRAASSHPATRQYGGEDENLKEYTANPYARIKCSIPAVAYVLHVPAEFRSAPRTSGTPRTGQTTMMTNMGIGPMPVRATATMLDEY